MAASRERYEEEPPPQDWKPKSRYWRWITARTDWHRKHPHILIPCPHCGADVGLIVTTETEPPDFVIRD